MFVGIDRIRVVRDLTEAWETAVEEDRIGVVVVEGPTRIGKTAVVQALYEQLAMRQARPAYWPATLDASNAAGIRDLGPAGAEDNERPGPASASQGIVWRRARGERIYPLDMAPAEGSRPEFFWWGLTARAGEFAVLGGDPQIKRHVQGIADAVSRGDRLTRERLVVAAKSVSLLAALGGLGPMLATMAANADTARDAVELLRSAPDVFRSRASLLEAARRRNSGTVFSVTARQEALAGAEKDAQVLGLAARVLPMLIAVEAAQFLDPVTITLLRALVRYPQSAGLVVLLVDSDQPSGDESDVPGETLGDWLSAEDRAQRLIRIRIGPLPADEMIQIAVAELGAGLDPQMLARVLDLAAGVPGILYDLLEAPAVARALRDGGAGPADLAAIPPSQGVRAALASTPAPIRRALAVASVHGRMTVRGWLCSPVLSPGEPSLAGAVTADAVDAAIEAGWLQQRPGTQVVEFAASHVLHVVRTAQGRELTPETVCAVRRALLAAVEEAHADHTWDSLDPDVRESLLGCVVEEDLGTAAVVPAELTAELFDLRRATGRDAASGELLEVITERLASGQAYPRVLTVATAEALFDAGRLDKAFQLLHEDYTRLQVQYGEDDARTRPALHNLAAAYAAAAGAIRGQPQSVPLYQTALTLYQKLLNARVKAVPVDVEQVIVTRDQYAQLLADCYHYREALTQYQTLLREQHTARGPDHPDTRITRGHLASCRGEAGDPAGAVAAYEELLADELRVLGPDHPDTLRIRGNLARWRGEAGDPAGAVAAFEELLADDLRVLGPDHPDTLTTRSYLASWRGEAGDPGGAAAAYEELLADRLRVLGPDHPTTLITRANLAESRGEEGDPAGAVAAYEELLADDLRVLGPDHPTTLGTRVNLARWRGEAGDPAGAAAAYEELLADYLRVLGPDHPTTLTTRHNLASCRGEAGDPAGAVAAYEELLADELGVLGPDHPDTLITRANLARWRGEAGDPAGAAAAYEELLADELRVLGPDNPDTLITRHNLASCRAKAGDPAGAAAAYEELLADELRVLGPDHPDTLRTRHNLASWRREAGDPAGAAAAYEELLADELRVLGPDHPDTLATRNNLASAYRAAGNLGRAIPLFEQTLADCVRVLGPDHPHTLTSRNNLAGAYEDAGDLGRAIPLYKQTLADRQRLLGEDHPDTLTSRNNLAGAYRAAGNLGRAIPLFEQTLADCVRVLGPDHPDTLGTRGNLAGAYRAAGDLGRAIPLFEQALADCVRVLGPGHPKTKIVRGNLAVARQQPQ